MHDYLVNEDYTLDELNFQLYEISKMVYGADTPELRKIQGEFFKTVYKLLLNKEKGPRLYLFLYAIDKDRFVHLLDFSTEKTEEETVPLSELNKEPEKEKKKIEYGDPDPVEPVKDQINLDLFNQMDLRVCKVLKCQEIRKSHSCYKITLFDGIKERTIVSSIKEYYTPEELVGKKIIVIANLEPTRITGVTSEGMLMAATNNACGCQVIFVDDIVPEGTMIR